MPSISNADLNSKQSQPNIAALQQRKIGKEKISMIIENNEFHDAINLEEC